MASIVTGNTGPQAALNGEIKDAVVVVTQQNGIDPAGYLKILFQEHNLVLTVVASIGSLDLAGPKAVLAYYFLCPNWDVLSNYISVGPRKI